MPYQSNQDLPESVRNHLPAHAQDIYRETFNSAWEQYAGNEARMHAVAWSAVKKKYHKAGEMWVEN